MPTCRQGGIPTDIEQILKQMTLDQKVAFLSGDGDWHTKALEEWGVPAIAMADGPNGLRIEMDQVTRDSLPATCYPAMASLASTWDRSLARRLAVDLAEECRSASLDLLLGPGVNIKRSPLCGRNFEYLSEDPYLSSELACAYVEALQAEGVGACLKHFAVNNQEFCRMTVDARVGQRALREIYLKSFEKTVCVGKPETVMSAYNKLNGIQMAEHPILEDILRKEWGFEGVVISDWGSVSRRDASTKAGMDLEMPDSMGHFDHEVYEALAEGRLTEAQVDACARRLLKLVGRRLASRKGGAFDPARHHSLAREIAERAMVLLKNENGILPLKAGEKVAVLGEFARTPRYQGAGSAHVKAADLEVPLEELRQAMPGLLYEPGCLPDGSGDPILLDAAVKAAKQADKVVVFAGLPDLLEAECYDRVDLELPSGYNELIRRAAEINPNVVVVLFAGSAVTMPWADQVKGILMAYLPGEAVGSAVTEVLTGKAEPTGRLAETFPMRLEDTPSFGNFPGDGYYVDYAEGIYVGYRWYDKRRIAPRFAFGQGEGYTTFSYGPMTASRESLDAQNPVTVTLDVTNTGSRRGREVVQLYVSQKSGRWGYVRQLKDFAVVELDPGAKTEVSFTVPADALAIWSEREQAFLVQDDVYRFEAAHHSRDIRSWVELPVCAGQYEHARLDQNVNVRQLLADPATKDMGQEIYHAMVADRAAHDPGFRQEEAERLGQSLFLSYPARNFVDLCSRPTAERLEKKVCEAAAKQKKK